MADVIDGRGGDVGNRLAHGHAPGGRGIKYSDGRALAHGHGFAAMGLKTHERDRHVRHGHLPGTDHLIT